MDETGLFSDMFRGKFFIAGQRDFSITELAAIHKRRSTSPTSPHTIFQAWVLTDISYFTSWPGCWRGLIELQEAISSVPVSHVLWVLAIC